MKRDERLVELSREHHTALKLARRLRLARDSQELLAAAGAAVQLERTALLQHFDEEEARLLPTLLADAAAIAAQLMNEHAELRDLLERTDEDAALERLGALLEAHVRFEERVMFPRLEAIWREADTPGGDAPASLMAGQGAHIVLDSQHESNHAR